MSREKDSSVIIISKMKADKVKFNKESIYNGKVIKDMTDEEKAAIVQHWKNKGCKQCIIEGYNDEEVY